MNFDRRMPLKDKISLGPIEKYTIYNRFPHKLSLHILLLILMSLTIQVQVQPNQAQLRSQSLVWYTKFMWNEDGDDEVPVMDDFNRIKLIFTTLELEEFVEKSLQEYYKMFENADNEFENYKMS